MKEEVEEFIDFSSSNQSRRWVFTINNPLGNGIEEVDLEKTNLPYKEDYYPKEIMKDFEESGLFNFKNIVVSIKQDDFTKSDYVIRRPFFKSIDTAIEYLQSLEHFKYSVFSLEKGEEEHTPHFQGFIIFNIGKRFATVKKYFPFAHIEPAKGSNAQCREYCTKSDTHISGPYEIGEFVEQRARTDKTNFIQLIQSGVSDSELCKLDSNLYLSTSKSKIDEIRAIPYEQYSKICRNVEITYIYGPPRTGKTSYVFKEHGLDNVFVVDNYGDYQFTGYNHESVILFDEFNGQVKPITKMNKLLEPYKLKLNIKGGFVWCCADKIYIVSNYPLTSIYRNEQKENTASYVAFKERIHHIIRFDEEGNGHIEQQTIFEDIPNDEQIFPGLTRRIKEKYEIDEFGNKIYLYNRYKDISSQELKHDPTPFEDEDKQLIVENYDDLKF